MELINNIITSIERVKQQKTFSALEDDKNSSPTTIPMINPTGN